VAWTKQRYVVGGVIAVGVLLLISEHGNQPLSSWDTGTSGGSSTSVPSGARPCTVTVTADLLNARSSPDGNAPVVETYSRGEVMSADRTTTNGFRQLAPGRWVAQEFVEPTPGSDCG
jgi:hypothetical protein